MVSHSFLSQVYLQCAVQGNGVYEMILVFEWTRISNSYNNCDHLFGAY